MEIPPASPEQEQALATWRLRRNQVVSACAGSGKSTLLLHAAKAVPAEQLLIVAYNRPLADDMTDALRRCHLAHATCMTFHGLASFLYELCPDDATLENVLDRVDAGDLVARAELTPAWICIDEAQDLRPLHIRLLATALRLDAAVLLVCGDARQLLYDYETPPASVEYMTSPETHLAPGDWTRNELSVSFRLTPHNAAFANALLEGRYGHLVGGNATSPNQLPIVMTCTNWDWAALVPNVIRRLDTEHARITILVRSTKSTNMPLLALVNELTRRGFPVYVHGIDGACPRVRKGKIRVNTWHAGKGTENEVCLVLGVSGNSDIRPLHVALTRARSLLIVVQDLRSPRNALMDAVRAGLAVSADGQTSALARAPPFPPPRPFEPRKPFDLTAWSPRCMWGDMSRYVIDVGGSRVGTTLPPELLVDTPGGCEDVTTIYTRAVLMYLEARRGAVPSRVREMLQPTRMSRRLRDERLLAGDRTWRVNTTSRDSALLPDKARQALRDVAGSDRLPDDDRARRWVGAAVAEQAFDAYHHRATRLLPATWASEEIFEAIVSNIIPVIATMDEWKSDMVRSDGSQVVRVDILSEGIAWMLTYTDRIPPTTRLRACVPLVLDEQLRMAGVVSVQTGERAIYSLSNREAFASFI